jgi:hypothetical protein
VPAARQSLPPTVAFIALDHSVIIIENHRYCVEIWDVDFSSKKISMMPVDWSESLD